MAPGRAFASTNIKEEATPTVSDLQDNNHYVRIAREHWLTPSRPSKTRPEVLKEQIWDVLESEGFRFRSLLILENLQILEKYGTLKHQFPAPADVR